MRSGHCPPPLASGRAVGCGRCGGGSSCQGGLRLARHPEPRGAQRRGQGGVGRVRAGRANSGSAGGAEGSGRADARRRSERDEGWLVPGPPARGGGGCAALAAGSLSSAQEAGTWVGCGLRGARARISSISPLTRPRAAPQTAAAPAPPEPPDRRARVLTAGPASPPAGPAHL